MTQLIVSLPELEALIDSSRKWNAIRREYPHATVPEILSCIGAGKAESAQGDYDQREIRRSEFVGKYGPMLALLDIRTSNTLRRAAYWRWEDTLRACGDGSRLYTPDEWMSHLNYNMIRNCIRGVGRKSIADIKNAVSVCATTKGS